MARKKWGNKKEKENGELSYRHQVPFRIRIYYTNLLYEIYNIRLRTLRNHSKGDSVDLLSGIISII